MTEWLTLDQIDEATNYVASLIKVEPKVGLILGSGLGNLAELVEDAVFIPYKDIPLWPQSTIQGHVGRLVVGMLDGKPVLVMQGRAHYYEGYTIGQIGLPVRVMQRLGIGQIIVTNAAGAINPEFNAGDVMLITDHINLVGMTGLNPLRGPNLSEFGERFPDMGQAYDRQFMSICREVAAEESIHMREGVYAWLSGPSFESPADIRFLHTIGADAVGMSTVPEVVVARHGRTRVLGLSGISNKANLDGDTETTHEEVLEAGKVITPKLSTLVRGTLKRMVV